MIGRLSREEDIVGYHHRRCQQSTNATAVTDGKRDGHHCRRPSNKRPQIIEIQPSQLVHRRHQPVSADRDRYGDAEGRRSHSDDDRKAAYSGSRKVRNSTDPRRHRRAGPERHLAAEVDASKEWTSTRDSSRNAPAISLYSVNDTYASNEWSSTRDSSRNAPAISLYSANETCAANSDHRVRPISHTLAFVSITVKKRECTNEMRPQPE